jgi:hypothetical protein
MSCPVVSPTYPVVAPTYPVVAPTYPVVAPTYPVVAEIWTLFESSLLTQAKRLTEDIAKRQGKDPKELWALIKPQVKVNLFDAEFPEPQLCKHFLGNRDGAIELRCRAPCTLGFDACPTHIHTPVTTETKHPLVTSVKSADGKTYYKDDKGLVRDKNGKIHGIVENDVLYLFEEA